MNKQTSNKVGRPKLADKKTKQESIIICAFILVVVIIIIILIFKSFKVEFEVDKTVGTIYNTHVNSCIIEDNRIDCGPNVTYMKYKIDGNEYIEVDKEHNSIEIELESYDEIKFCYKTNKTDLRCNK